MTDEEIKQLIEGNARAIQNLADVIAAGKLKRAESNAKLDRNLEKLTALSERVVNLLDIQKSYPKL